MTVIDDAFYVGPDSEPDKYRLRRQVGSGGEAELWEAETAVAGGWERVAVKVLRHDRRAQADAWRRRWADQVELLRLIQHPGVVGVHQWFDGPPIHRARRVDGHGRVLYLVMNWIEGTSLTEWVPLHRDAEGHFEALRVLLQVADVLTWLHSGQATPSGRAVIHGDLTPSNIIIDRNRQAVLVDFGLVKVAQQAGEVVEGTRGYWAPEVLRAGTYSPASDRYAFGGVTYYVLTGEHPPDDARQIRAGLAKVPLIQASPGLLDQLMRMFADQPEHRPPPAEWVRAFRVQSSTVAGRAGGLPASRPGTPGPRAVKRSRLRRWPVALAAVAVLLAGGLGWVLRDGSGKEPSSGNPPSRGATRSAITTKLTVMPRVVGMAVEDAVALLQGGGLTVRTTTVLTKDEPEGSVLSQYPHAGRRLTPVVRLQVARRPVVHYLAALIPISDGLESGPQRIANTEYPNSIFDDYCDFYNEPETEFHLGKQYRRFQATVGVSDDSLSDVNGIFQVLADGRLLAAEATAVGKVKTIDVDVSGRQRLVLRTGCSRDAGSIVLVWGDARLLVAPG
jgi:eukaryotic-like serine/threonine-protein kinase